MASHKEKCGCKWGELGWIELCAEHKAEHDEIHARAQRDYRRQMYPNKLKSECGHKLHDPDCPACIPPPDNSDLL